MMGLVPEKRVIIEFEEIEKQPKLIKGGQMKDYQVSGRCFGMLDVMSLTYTLASRIILSHLDA